MKTNESWLPGSRRENFSPPLLKHTQSLLPENMNQEVPGIKKHHRPNIKVDITAHVCSGVSFGSHETPGAHELGAGAVYVCLSPGHVPLIITSFPWDTRPPRMAIQSQADPCHRCFSGSTNQRENNLQVSLADQ